jgi:hypothetical protein
MKASCVYLLILLTCSLSISRVYAQVNFSIELSGSQQSKINKIKDSRKKLDTYHKLVAKNEKKQQDSLKRVAKKMRRKKEDQVKNEIEEKLNDYQQNLLANNDLVDSLSMFGDVIDTFKLKNKEDSLNWAIAVLEQSVDGLDDYPYLEALTNDSLFTESWKDSILTDGIGYIEKTVNNHSAQHLRLAGLPQETFDPTEEILADFESFKDLQSDGKEKIEEWKDKVPTKELAKSLVSTTLAKQKYITLPDINKPEEGIKRNSMEGFPLKRRLSLGGNIQLVTKDPAIISGDLKLGYRANKKWTLGVGAVLREQFGISEQKLDVKGDSFGYSFFVDYQVWQSFFAYGEYQQLINRKPVETLNINESSWQKSYLLGIGRTFSIASRLRLSVTWLYDFNHLNNNLTKRPWNIRFGYTWK